MCIRASTLGAITFRTWNKKGAREIRWDGLLSKLRERQRQGLPWSMDDTREADENRSNEATIEERHETLMELHSLLTHVDTQIQMQEERLNERPATVPPRIKERGNQPPKKIIRFDKNDKRYADFHIPKPTGGNVMYTPSEAITTVMDFMKSYPPPNRTVVRLFKEKMVAESVIPISVGGLNELIRKYGDKEPPK